MRPLVPLIFILGSLLSACGGKIAITPNAATAGASQVGTTVGTSPSLDSVSDSWQGVGGVKIDSLNILALAVGENSHVVSIMPPPTGFISTGSFADCGSGNCLGYQTVVHRVESMTFPSKSTNSVVLDYTITQLDKKVVGGPSCPEGYRRIGSNSDRGSAGNNCVGSQSHCILVTPQNLVLAGTRVVVGAYFTSNERFDAYATCEKGYEERASISDCSGKSSLKKCGGFQKLCVKYQVVYPQ